MSIDMTKTACVSCVGTPHCSVSDTNIHCYPCTDICDPRINRCFKCPKQCDSTVNKGTCTSVCSEQCLNKTCEYLNANLKCSDGCQEGRTGSYCQEFCPDDCATCDQQTSACTWCRDGHATCTSKDFCSVSDTSVRCLPCSEVCNPKVNKCFSCPIQCGKSISVEKCDSVCNENCRHERCEYENGKLKCSAGCENGRTGISCQEFCPPQCKKCDQFTSACTQCESGYGDNCTEVTKPNCFDGCPESSITEIQCTVIKQNVCREHSGCLARKTETTPDCIENIKETLNVSSCSFECVQQLCTPFLNLSTCAELDFNVDHAGRTWTVSLICGFILFAVLLLACLTIRCIMRRKTTLPVIESYVPGFPEAEEDDMEQNMQFTFALGAIAV